MAGIRESAKINTALLDYISANIREGMSTAEIDHIVYEFTTDHDAIPAPFMYDVSLKVYVQASMMSYAMVYRVPKSFCVTEIL